MLIDWREEKYSIAYVPAPQGLPLSSLLMFLPTPAFVFLSQTLQQARSQITGPGGSLAAFRFPEGGEAAAGGAGAAAEEEDDLYS